MEIKANFLLIGAFTLAGLAAIFAAFIWLGALNVDRDVARYGILFQDVSGLSPSGEVVFNGLPVGRVAELRLHEADPSLIYAAIEVDAATPVRADTVAQLTAQGVTGVAYIALVGGTLDAPPLPAHDDGPPLIPARRTGLQTLMADVPGLVEEAQALVADLRRLAGRDTQDRMARILTNTDGATAKLASTLDGMDGLTAGLADAADQIGGLGRTVAGLESDIRDTLGRADTALVSIANGFDAAGPTLEETRATLATTRSLLSADAPATLAAWREAGMAVEPFLARADGALASFASASDTVDALAANEAATLLRDLREAVAAATPALRDDLPAALSDLRAASSETRTVLGEIADGLSGATGQIDPLAAEARAALASATSLLDRARPALDRLDGAIGSADAAFGAAATAIETDVGPVMADLRAAADAIARDLPSLAARADAVLSEISSAVAAVAPGLRSFGATTLPEYGRLAADARSLVRSLSTFLGRIERDPVGVLQGGRVPEYRR